MVTEAGAGELGNGDVVPCHHLGPPLRGRLGGAGVIPPGRFGRCRLNRLLDLHDGAKFVPFLRRFRHLFRMFGAVPAGFNTLFHCVPEAFHSRLRHAVAAACLTIFDQPGICNGAPFNSFIDRDAALVGGRRQGPGLAAIIRPAFALGLLAFAHLVLPAPGRRRLGGGESGDVGCCRCVGCR